MSARSPNKAPLLPTSSNAARGSPPASPGQPLRGLAFGRGQRVRRVLLAGLLLFCVVNGYWASRTLYHAWLGRRGEAQQAGGSGGGAAAPAEHPHVDSQAKQQAVSAADNAVAATMDAAEVLTSAAGVVKHGAVAAGQAAGAALTVVAPTAAKAAVAVGGAAKDAVVAAGGAAKDAAVAVGGAAVDAAAAVGNATKDAAAAVGGAAADAAASLVGAASSGNATGNSTGSSEGAEQQQPTQVAEAAAGVQDGGHEEGEEVKGRRPLADLLPPVVADASEDACAQALGIKKVALLFLTKGELHHERAWRRWFASAAGLLPVQALQEAMCNSSTTTSSGRAVRQGQRQQGHGGQGQQQQRDEPPHAAILHACASQQPADIAAAAGAAVAEASDGASSDAALGGAARLAADSIQLQRLFSVYIHAPPEFEGYPPGSLWEGRLIPRRIRTGWGEMSLVEATRNLLWEAFNDPLNERFVLLSESDIPLYDPLTLHQQLMSEGKSRVNACMHPGRMEWRWSSEMETTHMNASHWRKSTQWIGLTREHAEAVLWDEEVYRSFERNCWSHWDEERKVWRDCFPDEHYFGTLLAVLGREGEAECDSWGVAAQDWSRGGAHPKAFEEQEVTPALVRQMRDEQKCGSEAAYSDAQRLYVDAAAALTPDPRLSCQKVAEAAGGAVGAGYAHAMPGVCPITARKFPRAASRAVVRLFTQDASCDPSALSSPAHGSAAGLSPRSSPTAGTAGPTGTAGPAGPAGSGGTQPQFVAWSGSSGSGLHLLTDHYCRQQLEGQQQ